MKGTGKRKPGMLLRQMPVILLVFIIFLCAGGDVSAKTVIFNEKNFPNKDIQWELFAWDYDFGEKLTKSDFSYFDDLDLSGGKKKLNLKGIEYFFKLSELTLKETAKSRKFPQIPRLKMLFYTNHTIEKVKLPRYPKLEEVAITGEDLRSFDLSNNKQIQSLYLSTPRLQKLSVSQFSKLNFLCLRNMDLPELDLSHNKKLRMLELKGVDLQKLDLSYSTKLRTLSLKEVNLPELDLSHNANLEVLELRDVNLHGSLDQGSTSLLGTQEPDMNLPELDLSHNTKLVSLTLRRVRRLISDLEPSAHLKGIPFDPASTDGLKELVLDDQSMEIFELSDHPALETLVIQNDSKLQKIVIKNCKKLKKLTVKNNSSLQEIQIEGCVKFKTLKAEKNPLLRQILSGEGVKLTSLSVKKCKNVADLGQMDLSKLLQLKLTDTSVDQLSAKKFLKLEKLSLCRNPIKAGDIWSFKNLKALDVRYEKSTKSLDVSKFPKLEDLTWTQGALKKVNFGKNNHKKLEWINLSDNQLSGKWDMRAFKDLVELRLNNNRITSIDFGKREQIEGVLCRNNKLKTYKSVEALNLSLLDCRDNPGVKIYMCHSDSECMDWRFGKKSKVYYKYG
ncbi:MAG: hypothetical protein NC293_13690 [Roseburia sp.]|nr:hypothetical protein [Roseburia sp.]